MPIVACVAALVGGFVTGRATSSPGGPAPSAPSVPCVRAPNERAAGASVGARVPTKIAAPARLPTSWQTLVAEEPAATQLVQQAVQARMADMRWARAIHACTRALSTRPSSVRFTATIHNTDGALAIVGWSAHVIDGPDVAAEMLDCARLALPTGALELTETWPGIATSLEYEHDMSLEGTRAD